MTNRAVKYRIHPTKGQEHLIDKTIGCARFVYNNLLSDYKQQIEEGIKPQVKLVTFLKQTSDFLNEVDSLALMNGRANLENALKAFYNSRKGERKGRKVSFPKVHSKHKSKWSYTTNNQHGTVRFENGRIKLPKIGFIRAELHRIMDGTIKSVTVTKSRDGKYYASVLFELKDKRQHPIKPYGELKIIGIDMSMEHLAVDSETTVSPTKPKFVRNYRKSEKRLARLQRRMSRKKKGSSNRDKARKRLAKLSTHVSNQRLDFCHKLSRYYADRYDVVVLETLNMASMARTLHLGKSVHDLGWGMLKSFLEYKLSDNGGSVFYADKWFASSKICHECGVKNTELKLKDRVWVCPNCGKVIERDLNAAMNLRDHFYDVVTEERYNTAGTAGINASGDEAYTLGEILGRALSLKEEATESLVPW